MLSVAVRLVNLHFDKKIENLLSNINPSSQKRRIYVFIYRNDDSLIALRLKFGIWNLRFEISCDFTWILDIDPCFVFGIWNLRFLVYYG